MVNILGLDLDGAFGEIKSMTGGLLDRVSDSLGRGDAPRRILGGGFADSFVGQPYGGGIADPFAGLRYGGGADLGFFGGGMGHDFGAQAAQDNLFDIAAGTRYGKAAKDRAAAQAQGQPQTTGSTGGGPSAGMSPGVAKWAAQAQQVFGGLVDPDVMLAIMQNESGGDPGAKNPGYPAYGLFQLVGFGDGNPNWAADVDGQFAAARKLAEDKLRSINASYAAHGLNPDERTRARDFALAWAGHFDYDTGQPNAGSTDIVSGQTAQQLGDIFLANYDRIKAGRAAPQGGSYHGVGGLPSLTGGIGSIGQEFGDTDFSAGNPIYDYGAGSGVHGHTGIDWAVPPGTQVYMPAGLSGTVITSGGTAFFRDEDENPAAVSPAGQGELKIRLSNGMELILGHMRNISVPVGTQLTAGMLVGLAGSANGGHIHVELRVADPSLPNGYRIIDPRTILGNTGGGGAQYR